MALEQPMEANQHVYFDAGHSGGPVTLRFPSVTNLPHGTMMFLFELGNSATSVTFASYAGDSPQARVMNPTNRTAVPTTSASASVQMKAIVYELRKDDYVPDGVPQWFCWWCV